MGKLIEQFIVNLNAGDIWVGFLMLAVFYVLKKEPFKILTHFNEQKIKDIDQAKSLLESNILGKEANELLREHLEYYSVKKYYGISADKSMRIALLKFHNKYSKEIGWHDLKRSYPYIKPDGSSIKIELSWGSHVGRWAVTGLSYFIGLYSILIIILAFLSKTDNQLHFFSLTFLSIILLVTAVLFSTINWPYFSAVKIKDCVK